MITNIGEIYYHKENKTNGGKQIEFSTESHLSYLMHPQKSYDAINVSIYKKQEISRNTNVHNSDVLNTVFKSECRSLSSSLFPWNLIFEHWKKSQHDWSSTNIANTLFWCCLQHLAVLVFHHTIPSLIPFESTQMEIKINIKYLPLKALKVYNVHIHIGRKPVLKLHQRLNPSLLRPIIN